MFNYPYAQGGRLFAGTIPTRKCKSVWPKTERRHCGVDAPVTLHVNAATSSWIDSIDPHDTMLAGPQPEKENSVAPSSDGCRSFSHHPCSDPWPRRAGYPPNTYPTVRTSPVTVTHIDRSSQESHYRLIENLRSASPTVERHACYFYLFLFLYCVHGRKSELQPFHGRNGQISPTSSDPYSPKRSKHSGIFSSQTGKQPSATGKRP